MKNIKRIIISFCLIVGLLANNGVYLSPASADDVTRPLLFNPDYLGQFVGMLPMGWSGTGATVGTWNNFVLSSWGTNVSGRAIYDKVVWWNVIYTFSQVNVYGGTCYIYFCYQDENNHYAIALNQNDTQLIKKVGGVETVLATNAQKNPSKEQTVSIIYSTTNQITATISGVKLFDRVVDTTFNRGKIGFGSFQGGGHFAGLSVNGSEIVSDRPAPKQLPATPTATPMPTPALPVGLSATIDGASAQLQAGATANGTAAQLTAANSGVEFHIANARAVVLQLKRDDAQTNGAQYGIYVDDAPYATVYTATTTQYTPVIVVDFKNTGSHKIRVVKLSDATTTLSLGSVTAYGTTTTMPVITAN